MALVNALAVGVGGAVGAVSRYAVGIVVERRGLDTFLVNVAGSFVFGLVFGLGPEGTAAIAVVVGFCGAFTTFSSFAVETVRLAEEGKSVAAVINAGGTLAAALVAALAGRFVGGMI